MDSIKFAEAAEKLATTKTIYVKGANGVKMTQANKLKYSSSNEFNVKRSKLIFDASEDTLGIDEIGMIKYLFPDAFGYLTIADMMENCTDISKDFSGILPGELVFMKDRVGIYTGDGKVIACSAAGVGETIVDDWVSHGKLNGINFGSRPVEKVEKVVDDEPVEEAENESSESEMELYSRRARHRH